jgi:outer membrane protein OmpA-like peptidoglycan-associated protein/tetratricopeptide (TPR) repeat protein
MNRNHILLFILLSLMYSCKAQSYKYSTKSEKAIKAYEKATKYYDTYDNENALKYLEDALKIDDEFIEAYMLTADIYSDEGEYETAVENYKKAIEIDSTFFPNNFLNAGINEYMCGKYKDAKKDMNSFNNCKNANAVNKKRAEYLIKLCDFGINAVENPVPFKPVNMGDSINTALSEYLPSLTADEQTLVITRKIPRENIYSDMGNTEQEDFYISHRKDSVWSQTMDMGSPINTALNEGAQCIAPDGQSMYYTACNRPDGFGSCDLYVSKKIGDHWGVPENLGVVVNSERWDSQPSISSDGKTLYFASARAGGKDNMDIWLTTKNDKGNWTKPVKLSDTINTDRGEMAPFIHPDNKTLYFSSNGLMGMGGYDIFYSRKDSAGNWGVPVNIGYPINTCADESYMIVNSTGDKAYFSSDMKEGKGGFDIYCFELYDKARPSEVTYMKGSVFSSATKDKLKAKFELVDLKTGRTVIESYSDSIKGEFLVCLINDNDYALNVSKDGYLFYSENFNLTGDHSKLDPYLKDIPLQPIKKDEIVILKNIFFDTDKYDLKPQSTTELEKLLDLLNKNPKIKIEISGHTDNVGDDKYNQTLSENRAKAVYDYLINKSIAKERLTYKGYGETVPIDTNDTEEGRANNRRTEFKVIAVSSN